METRAPRIAAKAGRRNVFEYSSSRIFPPRSIEKLQEYLRTCGPIQSLTLMLRVGERYLAELRDTSRAAMWWSLPDVLSRSLYGIGAIDSTECPLSQMTTAWQDIVGNVSPWRDVVALPGIHACILRGPAVAFQRLFATELIRSEASPVSGVIRPVPLFVPEHRLLQVDGDTAESRALLDTIDALLKLHQIPEVSAEQIGKTFQQQFRNTDRTAALDSLVAAMRWGRGDNRRQRLLKILSLIGTNESYVDKLGIGAVSAFGEDAGIGKTVCVIDSGLDESLPIFHGKVDHYERIDPIGHEKKAHDCTDAGCHGTKMGSIICAKTLPLAEFGISDDYVAAEARIDLRQDFGLSNQSLVRFAIAPAAKLDVRAILSGEYGCETTQMSALASVISSVVGNPRICAVNISIEANASRYMDEEDRFGIGRSLMFVTESEKAVIVAAGNHGPDSVELGRFIEDPETHQRLRVAYVVGAADRAGVASWNNGPGADLLATGVDVLCAQPIRPRLENEMLVAFSGSSLATAIVSGCVAALCSRYANSTPVKICETLLATKGANGMLDVNAAAAEL